MCYLTVSLLDECATFLEVTEQIHVGVILNTDGFIHEELRKDIFHPEGHIQDVRHLEKREKPSSEQKNMCFTQPLFGERPQNEVAEDEEWPWFYLRITRTTGLL